MYIKQSIVFLITLAHTNLTSQFALQPLGLNSTVCNVVLLPQEIGTNKSFRSN